MGISVALCPLQSLCTMAEKDSDELVFISYGREKEVINFVQQLTRDLQANGFTVWLDQDSISSGSDWHGAIANGLHECAFFIPVVTQKYANSRYCMNELYTADGDQKMLFPVMFDDPTNIDFESTEGGRSLKFIISGINWTMFRPGVDDYGQSLTKLIQGFKTKANHRSQKSSEDGEAAKMSVGPLSSEPIKVLSGLQYPAHVATGRNGEIVVASYMSHNVRVYNRDYELMRTIGSQGYMDGQFLCPCGIAVDKRNRIYVSSMTKVDVFTMEGQFLNSVGGQGNEPLQFSNACGIAFGKKGQIYVADAQNNRVQVLNSDLSYHTSISEASSTHGAGTLSQPQAVAVNSEGNVYIADMMNHCVQVFAPDGTFLLAFGEFGAANVRGSMCSPMAIAIDGKDHVYVGSSNGSIGIFDKEGNFLRNFGTYGSKVGQFNSIRGMHIDTQGRMYVSEWTLNRMQVFEGSPTMKKQEEEEEEEEAFDNAPESKTDTLQGSSKPAYMIGPTSTTPIKILEEIKQPQGVAEGKNGEVIIASWKEHKLFVYDKDNYRLITTIGGVGHQDGKFHCPTAVTITPDNLILVSSFNKLQWFTLEGKLVYAVGGPGKEEMQFNHPVSIALGRDGQAYVLDKKNGRVQIFNRDRSYNRCFKFPQNEEFESLAVNSDESLYFAHSKENCVHVFSSDGDFLFKFGKSGTMMERGALIRPNVIAIDSDDYVYVGSVMMVSIFDKTGAFIKAFGGPGRDPSQFNYITNLCISSSNQLYVSDFSNNRIQIFEVNQTPKTDKDCQENIKTTSSSKEPVKKISPNSDMPSNVHSDNLQGSSKPVYMIGPTSTTPVKILEEVEQPYGVAAGKNGEIVVASRNKHKVFVYSQKDDYQLVTTIGGEGNDDGMFRYPEAVSVTPDNLILVGSNHKVQWFTVEGKLVYAVGDSGKEEMQFDHPAAIALGRDGQVYVLDKGNTRVQIFNGDGSYNWCFKFPQNEEFASLAVNSDENLFFTYPKENCVHVFSSDGEFLFKFGKSGTMMDRETLYSPSAIAIDRDDYVYVGSAMMISIFDKTGKIVKTFGGHGSDPGQFNCIESLCFSNSSHLCVTEYGNNRIQIFEVNQTPKTDKDGKDNIKTISSYRRAVHTIGPSSDIPVKILSGGEIGEPVGITTSSSGDILVLNKKKNKVVVFDGQTYKPKEDDEITQLLWETSRDTEIVNPTDIAICEDGCLLMCVKNQLVKLTLTEDVIASVGTKGRRGKFNDQLDTPDGIAISKEGLIYVADKGNHRVQIFNPNLSYRGTCVSPEDLCNSAMFPTCVAVNSEGTVYVSDSRNNCINVFDAYGKFLFVFGKKRDRGSISSPVAIVIDPEDYVYVSGSDDYISIFDQEGNFIRVFKESGEDSKLFKNIKAMHIDHKGNLYVCENKTNSVRIFASIESQSQAEKEQTAIRQAGLHDALSMVVSTNVKEPLGIAEGNGKEIIVVSSTNQNVYVFNQQGELIAEFGGPGDLDGLFNFPTSVAVTSDNYILVSSHDKLQWFTMTGQLVYAVGSNGSDEVEFNHPDSIAVGNDDNIYVLEKKNKRVQILNGDGSFHSSFKFSMDHPPRALTVNSDGNIYLVDTRNSCVQILSTKGEYLKKISNTGSNNLSRPTAIAIDAKDQVYIGTATGLIVVFDKQGRYLRTLCGDNDTKCSFSHFNLISDLHVSKSGHIYVSKLTYNQVEILGPLKDISSEPEATSGLESPSPSSEPKALPYRPMYTYGPVSILPVKIIDNIKEPSAIITGPYNDIIIAGCGDHKIFAYNPAQEKLSPIIKELVNRVGSNKSLLYPSGIALTADNYFLVSCENQLLKLAFDGTVVAYVGNERKNRGDSNNELYQPKCVAIGKDGKIYLVDHGNQRIQIFDQNLQYVRTLCNPDSKERKSERLESIAFNSAGDFFVTDSNSCKVQVYSNTGKFRLAFGKKSSSRTYNRGCLSKPHAIAIDQEDFVYVGDEKGIISIFNKKGKFLRSFGGAGNTPGMFGDIQSMHIDSQGMLYVGEKKNDRVQVFQIQQRQ